MGYLPEPKEHELCPSGTHFGRCWQVVDWGTQETSFEGVINHKHQVQIGWEIPEEKMKDGRPFSIFRTYSFSMSTKSAFRQDLEAWRGKPFVEGDFRGAARFNIRNLIGVGATLGVIHTDSRDGSRHYANLKTVSALPKGAVLPEMINKPVYLWLERDTFDDAVFDALPEWMKDKVAKSPEFLKITKGIEPTPFRVDVDDLSTDEIPF